MPVSIDEELDELPDLHLYPALLASKGHSVLQPADPNLVDEAKFIQNALYATSKSTVEQRTAAVKLNAKLAAPTFELPDDQPPWMVAFSATLRRIETQVTSMDTRTQVIERDITTIKRDTTAMKRDITAIKGDITTLQRDSARNLHNQAQDAALARNRALASCGLPMQRVDPNFGTDGLLMPLPEGFDGLSLATLKEMNERELNTALDAYGLAIPGGRLAGDKTRKVKLLHVFLGGSDIGSTNYE